MAKSTIAPHVVISPRPAASAARLVVDVVSFMLPIKSVRIVLRLRPEYWLNAFAPCVRTGPGCARHSNCRHHLW